MSKSMYFKSIVVAMILCAISFAAASAQDQSADKAQPPQEKPSTDSVLVEAYLVEVSNAALASSGTAVLPGDGKKDAVSITKLLWCMKDPNGGKVADMARVICRTGDEAKNAVAKTVYVKQVSTQVSTTGHPIESVTYRSYDSKSEISATARIGEEGLIRLRLRFMCEEIDADKAAEGTPPGRLAYSFDSIIIVRPNQPMIVGGMQSGDSSLFLIVRAEIVK